MKLSFREPTSIGRSETSPSSRGSHRGGGGVKQGGLEGLRWGTPEPEKEPLPFEEKHGNLNPKPSTKPESLNPKPSTLNKADPALRRFDGSQEGTDRRELEPIGGAARGGLKGFWVV